MRSLLLASCLILSSIAYEVGLDRPYGDLPNMPTGLQATAIPEDCQALCNAHQDCRGWVFSKQGSGCQASQPLCWLKQELKPITKNACMTMGTKGTKTLKPLKYSPLKAGDVRPTGWLLSQLKTQATGLAGHLSEFWADIANSSWIGGKTGDNIGQYGERVPYWLNGLVPTAYLTNDAATTAQADHFIQYIVKMQTKEGWYGDDKDAWPKMPLLMALTQYAELNPSFAPTIVDSIWKYFDAQREKLFSNTLFEWGQFRYQDLLYSIFWVYDNHPRGREEFLLNFAEIVHAQGVDWLHFFEDEGDKYNGIKFPKDICTGPCAGLWTHGVNVGQALKSSALWSRFEDTTEQYNSTVDRMNIIDKYHGMASGIHTCSEHLAGLNPSQGSETCTVVETIYSYVFMFGHTGLSYMSDRIESLSFNALPASTTQDMWAHTYLQQSNEILSKKLNEWIYISDGADANAFGLAPWFGCCTANFVQGWPKYISHMFLKTRDNGIIASTYGPSTLKTTLSNGNQISIKEDTEYPFQDVVTFNIKSTKDFSFHVRIPAWAEGTVVDVNGHQTRPSSGVVLPINITGGQATTIVINFNFKFRIADRPNGAVAVYRGPLLYSLNIGQDMKQTAHYYMNSYDYEITPTMSFAWGIQLDRKNLENSLKFEYSGNVGDTPFSLKGTPVKVKAKFAPIAWGQYKNTAVAPPQSPVEAIGGVVEYEMIPYGAGYLRMTELPVLKQ